MKKSYKIVVSGRVQGVGFRWATRDIARKYEIRGFVKNLHNGNVSIVAEGNENDLKLFIKWCHSGPPHANVISVEHIEQAVRNYESFEVKY